MRLIVFGRCVLLYMNNNVPISNSDHLAWKRMPVHTIDWFPNRILHTRQRTESPNGLQDCSAADSQYERLLLSRHIQAMTTGQNGRPMQAPHPTTPSLRGPPLYTRHALRPGAVFLSFVATAATFGIRVVFTTSKRPFPVELPSASES